MTLPFLHHLHPCAFCRLWREGANPRLAVRRWANSRSFRSLLVHRRRQNAPQSTISVQPLPGPAPLFTRKTSWKQRLSFRHFSQSTPRFRSPLEFAPLFQGAIQGLLCLIIVAELVLRHSQMKQDLSIVGQLCGTLLQICQRPFVSGFACRGPTRAYRQYWDCRVLPPWRFLPASKLCRYRPGIRSRYRRGYLPRAQNRDLEPQPPHMPPAPWEYHPSCWCKIPESIRAPMFFGSILITSSNFTSALSNFLVTA